jgi:hypothetical protein
MGLIENWRHAQALARKLHPAAEYFAWGSDHDRWDPRWLEHLVAALERHPDAVLAFPASGRIDAASGVSKRFRPPVGDTQALASPYARVRRTVLDATVGTIVYGLFRLDALERTPLRPVLAPDRLLLAELALEHRFMGVPEVLWWRRHKHQVTSRRQRRAFFPERRAPLRTWLPWGLQHALAIAAELGVRGGAAPRVPRRRALAVAAAYPALAIWRGMIMRARRAGRCVRRGWRLTQKRVWRGAAAARRCWRRTA